MINSGSTVPEPRNETVFEYREGSAEKTLLMQEIKRQKNISMDIPIIINGEEIRTGDTVDLVFPHDLASSTGKCHIAGEKEIESAIRSALQAKKMWVNTGPEHRLSIFLRMAELISTKYRYILNAATMLNQSKTVHQAEIDATCETADFLRFNTSFAESIYAMQPESAPGTWNRMDYRPLEGFVLAVSPFNFTAIACNLATAPALMGNTVVWKPASTALLSGYYLMKLYQEAGLPDGVINFVPSPGRIISSTALPHPELGGVHFTGSTGVFRSIWKTVAENLENYRSFPRLVGETGGKDFILAHPSADPEETVTALVRGAFEYQGQKCSACSRAYIPESLWQEVRKKVEETTGRIRVGSVDDFSCFMNALIDEKSYRSTMEAIERAKSSKEAEIITGGRGDNSKGFFIEPTVIRVYNPGYETIREELFAPVLTIYVYPDETWGETLKLVDSTSPFGLTGAVFARDRLALEEAEIALRYSAGNFYINDKPTGAVVGQQPFGGARASGTDDKAGSYLNLLRWTSPRTIKETFIPPRNFEYPFMSEEYTSENLSG